MTEQPAAAPTEKSPSGGMTIDVSVIILSWNTRDYLRRCLASLLHDSDPSVEDAWRRAGTPYDPAPDEAVSYEIIVVDQESLDDSAAMVESEFPEVRLIRQRPNIGFAGGNNLAFSHARGRYLLLLNSDTVVQKGWLAPLVSYADQHARAGLVGPRLLNPDGTLQWSCRRFPTLGAGLFRHTPLEWLSPRNRFAGDYLMRDWDHARPEKVDWLSGAALLARRRMVEEIGGLDEGYFMYMEDVDWAWRARKAGWEVHYIPEPVVIHEIGRSSDRRPRRMIVMHHESAYRFFRLHHPIGKSAVGRLALAAGISLRAVLTLFRNEVIKCRAALSDLLASRR